MVVASCLLTMVSFDFKTWFGFLLNDVIYDLFFISAILKIRLITVL